MCLHAPRWCRRVAINTLVGFAALSLTACDENVEPRNELDQKYTVWGAFDPTQDLQVIRVVAITDSLQLRSGEPLDVTVSSINLDTGAETVWRDSLVSYPDSSRARVYVADLQPAFGSRHQLDVVPPVGDALQVYIPVPPGDEPILTRALRVNGALYTILWPGAGQLNVVRLTYFIQNADCGIDEHTYVYPGESGPSETGWTLSLSLYAASGSIEADFLATVENADAVALPLSRLRIDAEVASETWRMSPELAANPEALRGAEIFTNVKNGFGFVGSAYATTLEWIPTPEDLDKTGLFFPIRPGAPCGPVFKVPSPNTPEP